ncbi:MAG: hypothetical protein ABIL09_04980, partial [Gemmatimonadota bacterium]
MLVVLALLLAALLALPATALPPGQVVLTRAPAPPALDGALDDACWAAAPRLADFTRPESLEPPVQAVEARLAYDDSTLYVGVASFEADPGRMKVRRSRVAGDSGVWEDDCVEVWIRSGQDAARFHQFIVSAGGLTETHYGPAGMAGDDRDYHLRAAARIGADRWTCELAIPLAGLDLPGAPGPGELVQIKLGREDWASGGRDGAALATWPAGTPYGRAGYGLAFFGRDNLLTDSGLPQTVSLAAGALYRLTLQARGPATGAVTVRRLSAADDTAHLAVAASAGWEEHALSFAAPAGGLCEVALQPAVTGSGQAIAFRAVRLAPDPSRPAVGPALPVPADGALHAFRVVRVTDARAVRGFLHPPIDGSLDSR